MALTDIPLADIREEHLTALIASQLMSASSSHEKLGSYVVYLSRRHGAHDRAAVDKPLGYVTRL